MVAGFISMPFLTRVLTKEDYGLMSLVLLSLTFFSTVAAFGFPHAVTRFYYDNKIKGERKYLRQFCTSLSTGSAMSGMIAVILAIAFSYVLEKNRSFADMAYYIRFASVLIFIRVVSGVVMQIFRADKMPFIYNLIEIIKRYLTVLFVVVLVIYYLRNIKGVLIGTIVVEGLLLLICLIALYFRGNLDLNFGSLTPMVEAVKFGFPLVMADLLTTIVASSDRFVIQYFLNAEAVASYSVAYDLSEYIGMLFASPVQLAIMPIMFEIWVKDGYDRTSEFVSRAIKYSFIIVIPIACGFSVMGEQVITLVASEKYSEAGILVPFIISGVMISSMHFLFFSGLLIQKKSVTLLFINLSGGILNIILNFLLIPRFGILGAAYATLVTYIFILLVTYNISSKYLKINIDWKLISKVLIISIIMVVLIISIGSTTDSLILDLFLKTIIGIMFFGSSLLAVDREMRNLIFQKIKTIL
jgi:O-antigen/teichoic acid export membrane protein